MIKENYCNNCGKSGHLYHQCKIPITSIGVIAYRKIENETQFLLIRRKDTLGFIDFIRGISLHFIKIILTDFPINVFFKNSKKG